MLWLTVTPSRALSSTSVDPADSLNYVVIGAFSIKYNAVKLTRQARKYGAQYDINQAKQLYYVYVLRTENHDAAIREAVRLQGESEFTDAWVFNGLLGTDKPIARPAPVVARAEPTVTMVAVASEPAVAEEPKKEEPKKEEPKVLEVPAGTGKPFMFQLYRATDGRILTGEVDVIDTEKKHKIGTYKGNEPVRVPGTKSQSGQVSLVPRVFGYRKTQREIDYNAPAGDGITIDQDVTIVSFDLLKLHKGDVSIMYHVYFFRDAAIMRPESQYEVGELYNMLADNPKTRICLHGHANGNASGRIIAIGAEKNFFSLDGSKDSFGSSKALSEERASVVREYLISKGIDGTRVELKAWGGKKPLYDKNSSRAQENVRVEVEILEE